MFRVPTSALRVGEELLQEHHLTVSRTARYFTLGESPRGVEEVWFACHGYAQLAGRFLEKLRVLEDRQRYVVAPEGLSRFYLTESPAERRVGASWMTREDRLHEIDDYVRYLDALYREVLGRVEGPAARVTALGFSQGTATVSRWAALGQSRLTTWSCGVGSCRPISISPPRATGCVTCTSRSCTASGMSTSRARWSTAWWPAYASTTFRTACVRSTAATGWTKGC